MIIGTDVSIIECVDNGYLMVQVSPAIMKRTNFKGINIDYAVYKIRSDTYADEVLTGKERSFDSIERKVGDDLVYDVRVTLDLEQLIEMYKSRKDGIDHSCDCNHSLDPDDYDNFYDVFRLAQDVDGYIGIGG